MKYKLEKIKKINDIGKINRENLIGDIFSIIRLPKVGERFCAQHGQKILITTNVTNLIKIDKYLEIKTLNTIYTFREIQYD